MKSAGPLSIKKESGIILHLGLPLAGAQLAQISMSFVDTIMAGNYHSDDLASVAIGSSFFMPLFTLITGIIMAMSPIISQLFGARKLSVIGEKIWPGLWIALFLSLPVILILRHMTPVMNLFGFEPEVIMITNGYLRALVWGVPAAFLFVALRFFNEALGATRPALYITAIGLLVNIVANYTLIYGHFGFPEMGAVGTGWATAIVFWVMCILLFIYTFRQKAYRRFQLLSNFKLPVKKDIKEMFRIGVPIGISMGMETSIFCSIALLMGSLGTALVAAHQIAMNIASVTFMITLGLSMAITVRIGHLIGKKRFIEARKSGFTGMGICTVFMCTMALIMVLFPEQIIRIYTREEEVVSTALLLIIMAAIFQIPDGIQVSGSASLRGLKDTRIPMYVNLISYWMIGFPLAYITGIVYEWGSVGLWAGLIAGLSAAAVLHTLRFHKKTRALINRFPPGHI
ncbi:MATE family efflux transporter [Balneolaceae bacterium ANBcel3]|nr:MATE family efflux transporter [Balneolaceae bacterium ANBcel3]